MYDWPRRDISPKSILLDTRNPRLLRPGLGDSQKEIITTIFESSKVRELARNISENGYFPDEAVILIQAESGKKYVVVEGNRRIAACQALIKPDILKGTRHHQYARRLSGRADRVKASFQKVPCIVAPNREAARKIISNKHTKRLREHWSIYAQGNYYYKDMCDGLSIAEIADINGVTAGDVRTHIQMCALAETILALPWDEEKLLWLRENVDDLGLTPLSRVLGFTYVKENIARFVFCEDGNVTSDISSDEATKFIAGLVSHIHFVADEAKLTTRTANDDLSVRQYFSDKYSGYLPDCAKAGTPFNAFQLIGGGPAAAAPSPECVPEYDGGGDRDPPQKPNSRRKSYGVFLRELRPFLRNEKIDALLEEALRTSPKNKYATVFLIRSLLEVVLATRTKEQALWDNYVETECGGRETRAGLDSLLRYALGRQDIIPDTGDRRTIEAGLNTINSVFRKLANLAMHNDTFLLTDSEVSDIRLKVTPVLAHLIETE